MILILIILINRVQNLHGHKHGEEVIKRVKMKILVVEREPEELLRF